MIILLIIKNYLFINLPFIKIMSKKKPIQFRGEEWADDIALSDANRKNNEREIKISQFKFY